MKHLLAFSVFTLFLSIWGPRGAWAAQAPTPTSTPAAASTLAPTPRPTRNYPTIADTLSPGTDQALARLQACDPDARRMIWLYVAAVWPLNHDTDKFLALSDPFQRGNVWLNPKLAADAADNEGNQYHLMVVLAHEARHQWQYANAPKMTFDEQERDADTWTLPIFDQCPLSNANLKSFMRQEVQSHLDRYAAP